MRTENIGGHNVHWRAVLFGKLYFFAYTGDGTCYMVRVNQDGTMDML